MMDDILYGILIASTYYVVLYTTVRISSIAFFKTLREFVVNTFESEEEE